MKGVFPDPRHSWTQWTATVWTASCVVNDKDSFTSKRGSSLLYDVVEHLEWAATTRSLPHTAPCCVLLYDHITLGGRGGRLLSFCASNVPFKWPPLMPIRRMSLSTRKLDIWTPTKPFFFPLWWTRKKKKMYQLKCPAYKRAWPIHREIVKILP